MSEAPSFSPRVMGVVAAGVVVIFALSVFLTSRVGDEMDDVRATQTSPSAIGHAGFFALLRRLNLPATTTTPDTLARDDDGLLIVEEPPAALNTSAAQLGVGRHSDVLVVLPKRWGKRDLRHAGWIRTSGLLGLLEVQRIVSLLDRTARVVRRAAAPRLAGDAIAPLPALGGDVQLVIGPGLTPIIGDEMGMLLAEVATPEDQHVYVLADPDPLENFGIVHPANARFAAALVRALWNGRGSIAFDESVHAGSRPTRNPLQLLFTFPYNLVGAQTLVGTALLLLAFTARFGGIQPPPPPLGFGKGRLIDNIAALMERAGHQTAILRRFITLDLEDAARAMRAPAGLGSDDLATWLDRAARARGAAALPAADFDHPVRGTRARDRARLLAGAIAMRRWKKDLLDDADRRPKRR